MDCGRVGGRHRHRCPLRDKSHDRPDDEPMGPERYSRLHPLLSRDATSPQPGRQRTDVHGERGDREGAAPEAKQLYLHS